MSSTLRLVTRPWWPITRAVGSASAQTDGRGCGAPVEAVSRQPTRSHTRAVPSSDAAARKGFYVSGWGVAGAPRVHL